MTKKMPRIIDKNRNKKKMGQQLDSQIISKLHLTTTSQTKEPTQDQSCLLSATKISQSDRLCILMGLHGAIPVHNQKTKSQPANKNLSWDTKNKKNVNKSSLNMIE